jgi:hypothetical protein
MRNELIAYNKLRQATKFTLSGVKHDELLRGETEYLNLFSIEKTTEGIIKLRNPYIYRVFNLSFELGGRYYGGVFSNASKNLRKHLLINGNETCEVDYSCMHIRMLYHKKKIEFTDDAYCMLSGDDKDLRELYKLIGLVSINASCKEKALQGIRKEIHDQYDSGKNVKLISLFKKLDNESLDVHYQKWVNAHDKIAEFFNSDVGIELQNKDSRIAAEVIKHFTKINIPVLVVHDSFIIQKEYKEELEEVMKKQYYKFIKFKPIIK